MHESTHRHVPPPGNEMHVIRHEGEGVQLDVGLHRDGPQPNEKPLPIVFIDEHPFAAVSACDEVVQPAIEFETRWSRHGA